MVLQYAPWYLYRKERRDITDYAASLGIGVKHNRLVMKYDQVVRPTRRQLRQRLPHRPVRPDAAIRRSGSRGLGKSSYHPSASDLIWSLFNGLNKHPSYLLLGKATVATDDPYRQWALRLADRYTDVTVETTPGVWVALRDPLPTRATRHAGIRSGATSISGCARTTTRPAGAVCRHGMSARTPGAATPVAPMQPAAIPICTSM